MKVPASTRDVRATLLPAMVLAVVSGGLSGCQSHEEEAAHHEPHKIVVTTPQKQDVVLTQQYVCQIHSCRHIDICALEEGYLEQIPIREGQSVKSGDLLFKILPVLYQAKLDAENAEVRIAKLELENSEKLYKDRVVSQVDVALHSAKLAKAQAAVKLAEAELNFTTVRAPFNGIVDRLHEQQGSLVEEGARLTTLSDNSVMWVYFNVPEARYLEYMAMARRKDRDAYDDDDDDQTSKERDMDRDDDEIASTEDQLVELVLADGSKFPHAGTIGAIEAQFNNETGNIPFRADFPNPEGLLRHGQTGKVLIHREQDDAIVIPQRAVFEILAKQYVYVVDEDGIVHQREIVVQNELDDIFVLRDGINVDDRIILEGGRQVRDGERVEYEFLPPETVLAQLKYKAE